MTDVAPRRAPILYWVCVAYLLLATAYGAWVLNLEWHRLNFAFDKITDVIALCAYAGGTLALIARRRIAVVLLPLGLLVALAAIVWAVATRGFGPNFSNPTLLAGRAISLGIVLSIVFYEVRLLRRGFLR